MRWSTLADMVAEVDAVGDTLCDAHSLVDTLADTLAVVEAIGDTLGDTHALLETG